VVGVTGGTGTGPGIGETEIVGETGAMRGGRRKKGGTGADPRTGGRGTARAETESLTTTRDRRGKTPPTDCRIKLTRNKFPILKPKQSRIKIAATEL